MDITAEMVKELRERTGIGMMECKRALEEAGGDQEKAIEILRKKGYARAADKADRATREGRIGSYIHTNGKIGVLVEVNCETDFVAKNDDFLAFARTLAERVGTQAPADVDALLALFERLDADGGTRALVITGAGERTFSSGYTLQAIAEELDARFERMLDALETLPFVTIAALNGRI